MAEFTKLVLDPHRIDACKFDIGEFINNGQIEHDTNQSNDCYKVGNINKQYKSIYYGNGVGYNAKMQHINRVIDDFLYDNMVVLVKDENDFDSFAISSRYIYVVYSENTNKRYFCVCSSNKKQILPDFRNSNEALCFPFIDLITGDKKYIYGGVDKYVSLNQIYKYIIGIPTSFVTMEYLNNTIL